MIHIIFILIKPFSDPSCPMDGGIVILEETSPIRIEMFHQRIKVIIQINFVLICRSDQTLAKCPAACMPSCGHQNDEKIGQITSTSI